MTPPAPSLCPPLSPSPSLCPSLSLSSSPPPLSLSLSLPRRGLQLSGYAARQAAAAAAREALLRQDRDAVWAQGAPPVRAPIRVMSTVRVAAIRVSRASRRPRRRRRREVPAGGRRRRGGVGSCWFRDGGGSIQQGWAGSDPDCAAGPRLGRQPRAGPDRRPHARGGGRRGRRTVGVRRVGTAEVRLGLTLGLAGPLERRHGRDGGNYLYKTRRR